MDDLDRILHRILDPLFEHRPGPHRWTFAVLASILIALTMQGSVFAVPFDEIPLAGIVVYTVILLLLILQCAYPTLMGWLLVFGPVAAYSIYLLYRLATRLEKSDVQRIDFDGRFWLSLSIIILLPLMIFVFGRARKRP
jgi:hypothetical protein